MDFSQKLVFFFVFAIAVLVHALLIAKLVAGWPLMGQEQAARKEQPARLEAASEEPRSSEQALAESRQAARAAAQGQRKKPGSASEHATRAFGAFSIVSAGNLIGR